MSWSIRRKLGGTPVVPTAPAAGTDARDRLLPTGRLEGFSDGVFAIAITLLVIELHVPTGHEALVQGLEHEWPRYLGYFVSFAFIGGVWIAHSNMTRFLKAADLDLMRLNLTLLLFVSFLPFTTAIAATHLFASHLTFHELTVSSSAERVAVVLFGLNLTLAALMLFLMLRHAGRTEDVAADDLAEEELQAFATQRRSAVLLQASATVVGAFLPLLAVVFYLALAIFYVIDPIRLMRTRSRRRARLKGHSAENS
jgi:TMEM175 potassium channel family protein